MLAARGYKTKKDLKEAVGHPFQYTETSFFGAEYTPNGVLTVVGPSPQIHKWYANVHAQDGKIVKVT